MCVVCQKIWIRLNRKLLILEQIVVKNERRKLLETIDKSEIFSLIKEEQENKYNDKDSL